MMLRHILVGIDGSDYGETALQYAIYLAKRLQATLHGLHVVDIVQVESPLLHDLSGALGAAPLFNLTAQMRQNLELRGQQLLSLFRQTCDAAQVPCIEHLATGVVPTEIIRAAADVDLILLGRGGLHTRLSKTLLGSAVEGVVRRGAKPTMVTPQHYDQLRKPLLATDGSPSAMVALQVAARFALPLGLPIQVVHCTTTAEAAQPYLLEACSRLAAEGIDCDTDVCVGNAHEDLVHYMQDHGHDVLFMGAFGRRRVVEWTLGSTTQYLLRTCPGTLILCPAAPSATSHTRKEENHS